MIIRVSWSWKYEQTKVNNRQLILKLFHGDFFAFVQPRRSVDKADFIILQSLFVERLLTFIDLVT